MTASEVTGREIRNHPIQILTDRAAYLRQQAAESQHYADTHGPRIREALDLAAELRAEADLLDAAADRLSPPTTDPAFPALTAACAYR